MPRPACLPRACCSSPCISVGSLQLGRARSPGAVVPLGSLRTGLRVLETHPFAPCPGSLLLVEFSFGP